MLLARRSIAAAFVLILSSFLFAFATPDARAVPNNGAVAGTVTDSVTGASIGGATVALSQGTSTVASTTTLSNGTYTLSAIAPGTYTETVSASNYEVTTLANVIVSTGVTTNENAALLVISVAGAVTDAATSSPISGATVTLLTGAAIVASTTTKSDGTYAITGIPAGSYTVQFSASNYAISAVGALVSAGSTTPVNRALTRMSIAGTVTDASTGSAVFGATVTLMQGSSTIATTSTAKDGTYSFLNIAAGAYSEVFTDTNYQTATLTGITVGSGATTTENESLAIISFSGTVTDSVTSAPIAGATVAVTQGSTKFGTATTNSMGNYSLTGVPPGTYTLTFAAANYVAATLQQVNIVAGVTRTVNEALQCISIAGVVTDSVSANTVGGASVVLTQASTVIASTTTATNGSYALNGIPAGTYTLSISAANYENATLTGIVVVAGTTTTENVALTTLSVTGTVTDSTSGNPVSGVAVTLLQGNTIVAKTTTTSQGAYSLPGVAAGTYSEKFSVSQYAPLTVSSVTVAAGSVTTENAALQPVSVAGTITDSLTGHPISAVTVLVYDGTTLVGSATSATDGTYSVIGVGAGTYTATFTANNYAPATIANLIVSAGFTTTQNEVLAPVCIQGTVTSESTGNTISGVTVDLLQGSTQVATTTTASNGAYSFAGLSAGAYSLTFAATSYADAIINSVNVVTGVITTENEAMSLLAIGPWTLGTPNPSDVNLMTWLLTDGSILVMGDNGGWTAWYRYIPTNGDYSRGTWTPAIGPGSVAPSPYGLLYCPQWILPDGRFWMAGGEYYDGASLTWFSDIAATPADAVKYDHCQIYDPLSNTWQTTLTPAAGMTPAVPLNGLYTVIADAGSAMLASGAGYGSILVSNALDNRIQIYKPTQPTVLAPNPPGMFVSAASMPGGQTGDEETWELLPDGSVFTPYNGGQRYIPGYLNGGTDEWLYTTASPVTQNSLAGEEGPIAYLQNGTLFCEASTGQDDVFTPPATLTGLGSWTIPTGLGAQMPNSENAADVMNAIESNGKVLCIGDAYNGRANSPFNFGPTDIFEYDPIANTWASISNPFIITDPGAYTSSFLTLPTGQILATDFEDGQVALYNPTTTAGPNTAAIAPTITAVQGNNIFGSDVSGAYTLTGTKLTGLGTGSSYGDDYMNATGYPIVYLKDNSGDMYFCRTFHWTPLGTGTGNTVQTTQFTVPPTVPYGTYNLYVSVNGVVAGPVTFTTTNTPQITGFSPAFGVPGTAVTITGTGFLGATQPAQTGSISKGAVTFNGTPANYVVNSDTSITAYVPAGATTGPIVVTNVVGDYGTSATNFEPYQRIQVPTINLATNVNPGLVPSQTNAGSAAFTLTINGSNFVPPGTNYASYPGTEVTFGSDTSPVVTFVSSTQILVSIPAIDVAAAGTYQVQVINPPGPQGGGTASASFVVSPYTRMPTSITFSPASPVYGAAPATATVSLNVPAEALGTTVTLSSSNTGAATVPMTVVVQGGQSSATFPVTTVAVTSQQTSTIIATANGVSVSAILTVLADGPTSLTLSPSTVEGGLLLNGSDETTTATVQVNTPAPIGGFTLALTSSSLAAILPSPPIVTVPQGSTSAQFTVGTNSVSAQSLATISASLNGTTAQNTLTVTSTIPQSLTFPDSNTVLGGSTFTGTVTTDRLAPAGGLTIALTANNSLVTLPNPAVVTIPAGQSSGTFTAHAAVVSLPRTAVLTASTDAGSTNTIVTINPLSPVSVSVSPQTVYGGSTATGTVTLNGLAPASGATVQVTSDNPAATFTSSAVTIAANSDSGTFQIAASPVLEQTTANITATAGGVTQTAVLTIDPPIVQSLTISPAAVLGGTPQPNAPVGTVTLNAPAPQGNLQVLLTSSDAAIASVPQTVLVPAGSTSATFVVTASPVAAPETPTITASYNASSQQAQVTVNPPSVTSISVNPTSVTGGNSATGTITLGTPAPANGITLALTSDNPAVSVPVSATVAAGATAVSFPITTMGVTSQTVANIGITGTSLTAQLTVNPPTLVSVSLSPTTVTGGAQSTGTVTLSGKAPPGGSQVFLSATGAGVGVPTSVTVAGGNLTAKFMVSTTNLAGTVAATVTATFASQSESANLTVNGLSISSVTLSAASVIATNSSTGTVTLSAPVAGAPVTVGLVSTSASVTVPTAVLVQSGQTQATFDVSTGIVATPTKATITASVTGSTANASIVVNPVPGTTFSAGLAMISVPYDYPGVSPDEVFGYTGVKLAVWNPSAASYAITPTPPADAVRLGVGYWVHVPAAGANIATVGTPADPTKNFPIALAQGWNQIGDPFLSGVPLSNCSVLSGSQTLTETAAAAGNVIYGNIYSYNGGTNKYTTAQALTTGLGYWIYAFSPCTLVVPHP